MGTNYYLHYKRIDNVNDHHSDFHIGKNSCGWVFSFQVHKGKAENLSQMKEYTKIGYIYDEYGVEIPYKKFWDIVEHSKEPYEDGSLPKGLTLEGRRLGEYLSDGYIFCPYDFY